MAQALPQAPQLAGSFQTSMQTPPQTRPVQTGGVQTPAAQVSPAAQAWLQAPQLAASVEVSTQALQQSVPLVQVMALQTPAEQVCPAAQARPHPPQLAGSVAVSTQVPPQGLPLVQVTETALQTPAEQVCPAAHARPQPPQFAGSVAVSTQAPPQVAPLQPEQAPTETWFVSSVTAPFLASARPETSAPVPRLMLVSARMLPAKLVPAPRVAELPTCQKTLQLEPPLITWTEAPVAVVRVLPIWKMKTASGLPCASSTSAPTAGPRR